MGIAPTPRDGDVVIRRVNHEGAVIFVLLTIPGTDQIAMSRCESALAKAVAFAKAQRVSVWLTEGEADPVLIEDFRTWPRQRTGMIRNVTRSG